MRKFALCAAILLAFAPGPVEAAEPEDTVDRIYGQYPWQDVPPGGAELWYPDTAAKWDSAAADAGMAFLTGGTTSIVGVATEVVLAGEGEARVQATVTGGNGAAHTLNFGVVLDDELGWLVIEVFTDDGRYLSDILSRP